MTSSVQPSNALGAVPDGLESIEMFKEQVVELAQNEVKEWLLEMWDWINPFNTDSSS